jgi:hypothetical protein
MGPDSTLEFDTQKTTARDPHSTLNPPEPFVLVTAVQHLVEREGAHELREVWGSLVTAARK